MIHFSVKFTIDPRTRRLTGRRRFYGIKVSACSNVSLFNGRSTRIKQRLLWMFGGRVLVLYRMTRGRRRDYVSEKKESVVPFGAGQWKEPLVNCDGSPTEACWVYSTHTHTHTHPADTSTQSVQRAAVLCVTCVLPIHLLLVTACYCVREFVCSYFKQHVRVRLKKKSSCSLNICLIPFLKDDTYHVADPTGQEILT